MSVGTMLREMSSEEIATWGVFFKLEAQDIEMAKNTAANKGSGAQDFPGPEALLAGRAENN